MGGENKTVQTQTQDVKPFKGVAPVLDTGLKAARNLYDSGTTKQLANMGKAGIAQFNNTAKQFGKIDYSGAIKGLTDLSKSGGLNAYQTSAMNRMGELGGMATDPSYAEQHLGGIARGDFLNQPNADFEHLLGKASTQAATEAAMAAGAAGRTASPYAQRSVADTVGTLQADARLGQYNLERDRQVQATGMLDAARQAGLGLGMNAATGQFGMGQTGVSNLMGMGGAFDSLYSAAKQPGIDRMSGTQAAYDNINNLMASTQYALPYASTSSSGSTAKPTNWLGLLAGGLLGAGSIVRGAMG